MNDRTGVIPKPDLGRPMRWLARRPVATLGLGVLLINGAVVLWLLFLGRSVLPANAALDWWNGSILRGDNSQHLMDFYSILHAMSGAALFFAVRWIRPAWPVPLRLLLVIVCSGGWEAVENTPWVIAVFNGPASPGGYQGDSIVNALSDTAFVALGFLAAHSFPRWLILVAGVLAEVAVAVMIHDGFVLGTARLVLR